MSNKLNTDPLDKQSNESWDQYVVRKNSIAKQDFEEPTGWKEQEWNRQPEESWDQYVVRKMKEERESKVYPVREDVPAELWDKPIYESPDKGKTIYKRLSGAPNSEKELVKPDMVNHPPHYNKGIETIKYIKSWDMSYAQGNVIKYITRYNVKHTSKKAQLEDLKKAQWYLKDLIQELKN